MNGICYIIGAGEVDKLDFVKNEDDFVICADGGLAYAEKNGIVPDLKVGDFDSFGSIPGGENVIVHPTEKDETDSYLAIQCGIERGYSEFVMYGMLGGRIDHSLANIQLLSYLANENKHGVLVGTNAEIEVIKDAEREFNSDEKGILSVFSFSDVSEGVTISNLKYEVEDVSISSSFPIGVSNEFIGKKGKVSVKNGTLLLIKTFE